MAELLRRELGEYAVSRIALYILLRLAEQGERIVDEEKLTKLLFFAIYTEPGQDKEPVLRENPPRLSPEMEFRIYLHGPYIRIKKLIENTNKLVRILIGRRDIKGLSDINGKIVTPAAITDYMNELIEVLRKDISRILGEEHAKLLDSWVVGKLGRLPTKHLTTMALRALYLETDGPPVKKAMIFNMSLDDYIDILRVLKKISKDLEEGRLHPDYELDEILEEK